jgi:hypothetical protein
MDMADQAIDRDLGMPHARAYVAATYTPAHVPVVHDQAEHVQAAVIAAEDVPGVVAVDVPAAVAVVVAVPVVDITVTKNPL